MEIKDYLHLYLGCDVAVAGSRLTYENNYSFLERLDSGNYSFGWDRVKPILRPLSDMTEEERGWWWDSWKHSKKETLTEAEWVTEVNGEPCEGHWTLWTGNIEYGRLGYTIGINNHFTSAQFLWLLSKHFDLFGLIESGLAIDATKVERTSE